MTNKSSKTVSPPLVGILFILFETVTLITGCSSTYSVTPVSGYEQINLVADTAGYNTSRIDINLLNAWGMAISPSGAFWIAGNHSGMSIIYDGTGKQVLAPVNIPLGTAPHGSSPSGVIFNSTTDFTIPGNGLSSFIFSTEDGILSAWNNNTGGSSITVVDRSLAGAVYKGLAIANDGGANFIYATDFHNGKIDVFDTNFSFVTTKPFNDPDIPAGFAPFNIQNIDGQLYVTYAKQLGPDNHDDNAAPGNGYVDIYSAAGILVKRFAAQGTLNSPWGMAKVRTAAFGQTSNAILIGNFGDGHINVFDSNGTYQGQLMKNGSPISIPALWAIMFDTISPADPSQLYFTAGPGGETHGLFGYVKKI
jgi:uncharacterized protein (TIGR03118 family)